MTKIALAALPAFGHVYPLMPLGEALAAAGAEVRVAVGEPFLDRLSLPTEQGIQPGVQLKDLAHLCFDTFPGTGDDMANRWLPTFFGWANPRLVMPELRARWRADRPDLVIAEMTNFGAVAIAEELGIPCVVAGISHTHPGMAAFVAVAAISEQEPDPANPPWAQAEALAAANPRLRQPYLDPMPASLQFGRLDLLSEHLPIRPVAYNSPSDPTELPERTRPRRCYVTLGTVSWGAVDALRAALLGAAEHRESEVIVACGPGSDLSALGDLPSNVRAFEFVAQSRLLPTCDLVVHHGGAGTMLASAAAGVPQLILPQGADQFINADVLERSGAGRSLAGQAATREAIAEQCAELLAGQVHGACESLAAEIAARPSPESVARDLLARYA